MKKSNGIELASVFIRSKSSYDPYRTVNFRESSETNEFKRFKRRNLFQIK